MLWCQVSLAVVLISLEYCCLCVILPTLLLHFLCPSPLAQVLDASPYFPPLTAGAPATPATQVTGSGALATPMRSSIETDKDFETPEKEEQKKKDEDSDEEPPAPGSGCGAPQV